MQSQIRMQMSAIRKPSTPKMPYMLFVTNVAPMKIAMNTTGMPNQSIQRFISFVSAWAAVSCADSARCSSGTTSLTSVACAAALMFHSSLILGTGAAAPVVTKSSVRERLFGSVNANLVPFVTHEVGLVRHFLADYAKLHQLQVSGTSSNMHVDAPSPAAPLSVEPTGLRERKKQRTRESIASAALDLFGERGYHAATVADIAAAADVSERTVFTYFPTKEDMLFSDLAGFRERLSEALAERPAGASALDTLRDFVVENLSSIDASSRLRWEI